jgi:hypothetical protein
MALVMKTCEKLLRQYEILLSEHMDKSRKKEGDYHAQR